MRGGSITGRGLCMGVALSGCALALWACGASDESESRDGSAKSAVQAGSAGDVTPGTDGTRAPLSPQKRTSGSADSAKRKRAAASNEDVSVSGAAQPARPATPGSNSGRPGSDGGKEKPSGKIKAPPGDKPKGGKPPPFLPANGGDPYQAAKRLCGDQALVDTVPPEYRGDAEHMARLYADIFDPTNKQQAYEGCLAGLRSLGL